MILLGIEIKSLKLEEIKKNLKLVNICRIIIGTSNVWLNSSYSKDKDVFKRKAGDFENFADFKG